MRVGDKGWGLFERYRRRRHTHHHTHHTHHHSPSPTPTTTTHSADELVSRPIDENDAWEVQRDLAAQLRAAVPKHLNHMKELG